MRRTAVTAVFLSLGLALTACGSRVDPAGTGGSAPAAASCVDTSGSSIKIGFLNSRSGTMAISENTVYNSLKMASDEINAAGGVLGKQLTVVAEDGASEPTVFAEKAQKLIRSDCVAAVFGGWTSSSRKAMLPVFEGNNALLFYPVQYEGLESSKNIFYTGATTNQQIVPALDYLKEQGAKSLFLVGSDYVFPQTANKIIKAYAAANGMEIKGEEYAPLGYTDFSTIVSKVKSADADAVFNTLNGDSNVAFFKEYKNAGLTADAMPVLSVSIAEEEVGGIGIDNIVGQPVAWNYYQTIDTPGEPEVRRRTSRPSTARTRSPRTRWRPPTPRSTCGRAWSRRRTRSRWRTSRPPPAASASTRPRARSRSTATTTTSPRPRSSARSAPDGLIYTDWIVRARRSSPTRTSRPTPGPAASAAESPTAPGRAARPCAAAPAARPHRSERARMGVLVTQVFNGLSVGSILLLAALGLALTFGQMGVINMAHGEFIMAGAYTAYVTNQILGSAGLSLLRVAAGRVRRRRPARRAARGDAAAPHVPPPAGHAAGHLGRRAGAAAAGPRRVRHRGRGRARPGLAVRARRGPRVRLPASRGCSSWRCRSRRSRRWPPA